MTAIHQMRNLGPKMDAMLAEVGIDTADDLRAIGAVAAYRRLRLRFDQRISLTALYAMEAALLDLDWRDLPVELKVRLVAAVDGKDSGDDRKDRL